MARKKGDMMITLPTIRYRGKEYTVDERLQEFRHIKFGEPLEFIPFASKKGSALMLRYDELLIRKGMKPWKMKLKKVI
jgi:hypothetical protein